ncbi:MAG: hypothetical protein R2867_09185 [Caldilineaceae bacterium]
MAKALVATVGAILLLLLIIWWRQQKPPVVPHHGGYLVDCRDHGHRQLLLFEVPVYYANCPAGCTGWRGFPLPYALIALNHVAYLAPGDFAMNVLTLWLLWLAASVLWRILVLPCTGSSARGVANFC